MIKVFALKKKVRIEQIAFNKLILSLSESSREKINSKVFIHDKEIALLSQILIRYSLLKGFDLKGNDIEIDRTDFGKPFLRNHKNIFFNLTHSGDYVILAISDKEVGIDIEQEKEIDIEIADKFFSKSESKIISSAEDKDKKSIFFRMWTQKESYLKAIGLGLSKPLDSFSVESISGDYKVIDSENLQRYPEWKLDYFIIEGNYHFSICSLESFSRNSIQFLDSDFLIDQYLME
ncbi:MAG: 4'-phosphopantetheinyl transferase superfamily protein [Spirochaetaceae bacterium]|nr:4'-phosphopantetheinyl transferase superfamily protein [Spirochaetaceae bacterium]